MAGQATFRVTAAALFAFALCALLRAAPVWGAQYAVTTIYNDTHVTITQLYDRTSGQTFWGVNDLTDFVKPGQSFTIRIEQNATTRCPAIYRDFKLVFSNGAAEAFRHIAVCKYDVKVHRP